MSHLQLVLLVVAIAAVTFVWRLSFIAWMGRIAEPAWMRRSLRFVPASALAALVVSLPVSPAGASAASRRVASAAVSLPAAAAGTACPSRRSPRRSP